MYIKILSFTQYRVNQFHIFDLYANFVFFFLKGLVLHNIW